MPGLRGAASQIGVDEMKLDELVRYGIPEEMIQRWRDEGHERLLPLQEAAVKRHGLFGGGNLLIQAPTSSGKTFVGELAAVETALRRKQVIYLAPLKALAEEKYRLFEKKYGEYGLEVILSTRDHRNHDRRLEAGSFSLAVVVYEKLAQLLVRRPERLAEVDLVIADELEILSDPDRGGTAEILLTRILRSGCRLIGLSAVLGRAEELAHWLNAELVRHDQRPVELRYGVLHEGIFRYRTHNSAVQDHEQLAGEDLPNTRQVLEENVERMVERGETCLLFVKSKHEARQTALRLSRRLEEAPARDALEELARCERTRSRDWLEQTLQAGVAFHNSDLTPEERRVVEDAFRTGAIRVVVSTSTLAVGLNLPARNVFIAPEKWRFDARFGMPWKAPILRGEYESMGGRAGRFGAGHEYGRSIVVAGSPFEAETLWRQYVEGEREPVSPQLNRDSLEDHIIPLVASRTCRTGSELFEYFAATLTGRCIWSEHYTENEWHGEVEAAVYRALDAGALTRSGNDQLEATPFGRAVAFKGLSLESARTLEAWIAESEPRRWCDLDLLLAAALTPEGRMAGVALKVREYEEADYPGRLRRAATDSGDRANVPLNRFVQSMAQPFFE
ncbi:MAG: DEAD/DEAH box helicase, partial [Candidatus Hydrogenedentales bacterium]